MQMRLSVLIVLLLASISSKAQDWPKVYGNNIMALGYKIMENYDHGYLICGSIMKDGSTFKYGWIIKTDINGNVLWDRKFGDSYREDYFLDMDKTEDNGWIISGVTSQLDIMNDPVFVKLNTCGEIEWCKIYPSYGFNAGNSVISLDNGDFLGMLRYYGDDGQNYRISLVKMDANGEPLWIKNLAQQDTVAHNEDGYNLYLTPDSNYLVTCRTFNPVLEPFFIKTDTSGEELWNLCWSSGTGGRAYQTAMNTEGILYSATGLRFPEKPKIPYILKFNENGQAIDQYSLMGDTIESGNVKSLLLDSDTSMIAGLTWTQDPNLSTGFSDILRIDTLGNTILRRQLIDQNRSPECIVKTFDSKYLALGIYAIGGNWDIYLWKLNQDLQDDTLSTQTLTYDSLCPYPIVNDTLALDCGLFVDIKEIPTQEQYESTIRISPNPAKDWIVLNLPEGNYSTPVELSIYNLFGQEVKTQLTRAQDRNISLNISDLSPGLYIAVIKSHGNKLMKGKFIVER